MLCHTRSGRLAYRVDKDPHSDVGPTLGALVVGRHTLDSRGKEVADQLVAHFHLAAKTTQRKGDGGD